jgi:tetratricopeptide (TPR) repeat protein
MFGIGILVALGRRLVAATLADTGLLPAGYYRHLALAALEEEDFPQALTWLPFAQDPLLTQLLVLRLRLLAGKHEEQRQAVRELLDMDPPATLRRRVQALLEQENRALELLGRYEGDALNILRGGLGQRASPTLPSNFPPSPL